jgi:hypothetical protein
LLLVSHKSRPTLRSYDNAYPTLMPNFSKASNDLSRDIFKYFVYFYFPHNFDSWSFYYFSHNFEFVSILEALIFIGIGCKEKEP